MAKEAPDYALYEDFEGWTLRDALDIVSSYSNYKGSLAEDRKLSEEEVSYTRREFRKLLARNVKSFCNKENVIWVQVYLDDGLPYINEYGDDVFEIGFDETVIDVKRFIRFARAERLPFPDELVDAFKNKSKTAPSNSVPQKIGNEAINDITGFADNKYPEFKGIDLEGLTKEQFTEIKTKYGLLREAESKYRRALPIATKIGLLFYERSLNRPATKPAFLEAYKQEFDAILKNDSLAKEIYSYLPEEYRGGSKAPDSSVDLMPMIRAAVYAGSIYDTEDVKVLKKLKAELSENEYELPSDEVLSKIIEATKEV